MRNPITGNDLKASNALHLGIFHHKGLMIDTDQACVILDGEEIHLTPNEFHLLVILASSMGNVVSYEELISSIWGHNHQTNNNVLWITISRLRKKIERNPQNPIHIVRREKIGYIMP
jgi:DNA-binding response OmpR family regulator